MPSVEGEVEEALGAGVRRGTSTCHCGGADSTTVAQWCTLEVSAMRTRLKRPAAQPAFRTGVPPAFRRHLPRSSDGAAAHCRFVAHTPPPVAYGQFRQIQTAQNRTFTTANDERVGFDTAPCRCVVDKSVS